LSVQPIYRFRILLLFTLLGLVSSLKSEAADIAIIVHPDVPLQNVTFTELQRLVLGDRQFWNSNLRVTLLLRAPVARERDVVLKKIYQMTEAQYRQYWIGKVFRAESTAGPKTVYSSSMAVTLVASIPGALTFIDVAEVPRDLKIVRVNGLLPGEPGYPLH
jgi:hypothetical protein